MGIYDGFEGYCDPTETGALQLLENSPIIIDTNVLLDIYSFEEPARILALEVLESVKNQVWVPYQVMREFWRNRQSVIADIPAPVRPLEILKKDLQTIVNGLRPDRERPEDINKIRETIDGLIFELETAIDNARGTPLDVDRILRDSTLDPVLQRLENILDNRIGPSLGNEEASLVDEGLRRFAKFIPPGYADGEGKKDQMPERGTGDFLIWEQTLRYIQSLSSCDGFIFVTNDSKEDWRVILKKPQKRVLGIRPELVAEALERTNCSVTLLSQGDFYRLMAKLTNKDEATSDSLIVASSLSSKDSDEGSSSSAWSYESYEKLLTGLTDGGYEVQANVIKLAARNGGFVKRSVIYEHADYSEDRSLRKFSTPAQRVALTLVDEGVLREDAASALEAVYEGAGKTIGYQVPFEFVEFERMVDNMEQLTWLQAAATVASEQPDKTWTISELVAKIEEYGLRDLSGAKTPEATLRRDISLRGDQQFVRVDGGYQYRLTTDMNSNI